MDRKVDLFDSTYRNFEADVLARIRRSTFGEDFGQNSWTTAEEYRRWTGWLELGAESHVLEVASGSGGPAIFLAQLSGARVTGVDLNALGVKTAAERSEAAGLASRVTFEQADACERLPFPGDSFDAVVCIDSANHLLNRREVLADWCRVLKPGGRALFTDPVLLTGLVTSEEIAVRSAVGEFLFSPPRLNEHLIEQAGFRLERVEDVSGNAATVSRRWRDARAEDREALLGIEGKERFEGLQEFFATVHRLTSERRLSRFVYVGRKPAAA